MSHRHLTDKMSKIVMTTSVPCPLPNTITSTIMGFSFLLPVFNYLDLKGCPVFNSSTGLRLQSPTPLLCQKKFTIRRPFKLQMWLNMSLCLKKCNTYIKFNVPLINKHDHQSNFHGVLIYNGFPSSSHKCKIYPLSKTS